MNLVEIPGRRGEPRTFVEADPALQARLKRALRSLGDLSDDFPDAPGLGDLADWMIATLDELEASAEDMEPDPDFEDDELGDDEALPLFAWSDSTSTP
jgi:hypothetical protein